MSGGISSFCAFSAAEKAGCNDAVEEHLAKARRQDGVGKLLKPNSSSAALRLGRNQHRLGELRFEIGNDGARIRDRKIAVSEGWHLAEGTARNKVRVPVAESNRLQVHLEALLGHIGEGLAHKR